MSGRLCFGEGTQCFGARPILGISSVRRGCSCIKKVRADRIAGAFGLKRLLFEFLASGSAAERNERQTRAKPMSAPIPLIRNDVTRGGNVQLRPLNFPATTADMQISDMATLVQARPAFTPAIPSNFEELGISQTTGSRSRAAADAARGLQQSADAQPAPCLSVPIVDIVFRHMRQQQLVEVKGMMGNDYNFVLSQAGKPLAAERFQITQYAGRRRFR